MITAPQLSLTLDGQPAPAALAGAVRTLGLHQSLGAPAVLELSLARATTPDPLADALRPGVQIGLALAGTALFDGSITGIAALWPSDNIPTITLTAHDALHRLGCRQSMIQRSDISAAGLAALLADELGVASHCTTTPPVLGMVLQQEQSDLDLLADVATAAGLWPVLRPDGLHLLTLAGDGASATPLRRGQNLLALQLALDSRSWLPGVQLAGRDRLTLAPRRAETTLASQDAVEMRDPGPAPGGPRHLLNRATGSDDEAAARAGTDLDHATARMARAEGLAEGDPALTPGRIVMIDEPLAGLGGQYVLTRTLHRISPTEGYVTEFSTEPPHRPARPRASVASIGQVASVDDPEALGRCQVTLPDLGLAEGVWMHVVIAGAGPRRGVAALPEVGDDVLVVLPEGDPAHGLVLGGLWGTRRPPQGATDTPRGITLRSGDGQALQLHGKGGRAQLSNRSGSLLDLRPGQVRLAAAGDLLIEAPGRTITIRADAVNFERG